MTDNTVKILGWIFGRLEFLTVGYDRVNIPFPERTPVSAYARMQQRAEQARVVTKSVDAQIRELFELVDVEEFVSVGSPEKVIPLTQQGIWQLAYYKGKSNKPLSLMFNISRARKEKGLTQADLAKMVGVSQAAVAKWESGESSPKPETLEKIKSALQ